MLLFGRLSNDLSRPTCRPLQDSERARGFIHDFIHDNVSSELVLGGGISARGLVSVTKPVQYVSLSEGDWRVSGFALKPLATSSKDLELIC